MLTSKHSITNTVSILIKDITIWSLLILNTTNSQKDKLFFSKTIYIDYVILLIIDQPLLLNSSKRKDMKTTPL